MKLNRQSLVEEIYESIKVESLPAGKFVLLAINLGVNSTLDYLEKKHYLSFMKEGEKE